MSSGTPQRHEFDRREPIPGYRTTELLGRGGYGEVWKAIAPGGIAKAVKIIYGDADPTKAEGELRALARIKDVRHPLLLSIERIEMCEGNLVIVTELADGSLKDRFLQLRQAQSLGVPQDELIRCIGDAAEALDYLYESYSLQHLDVKPENILILSGRGKLGDFGLVKNLYERSASLVGGLTPTYAPPELFEGKPNRHSDQYSLAIVYTHMLTGNLPFPSGSTAQLAAAHLRGVPDLSALPRSQRSVIARAMSKDPTQRYPSCMALMAALKESLRADEQTQLPATPQPAWPISPAPPPLRPAVQVPQSTAGTARNSTSTASMLTASSNLDETTSTKARNSEPPVGIPGVAPKVLIGIGGLGVEVMGRLVDRLNDRFGASKNWPAVEIIVLDSHTRSLTSRFREQDLDRVHVVPIPLKPADAYGNQTPEFLKWLGRRWFYNIPRDLTTNGFRPLGRLALISNGARVRTALANVIGRAAAQSTAAGLPPQATLVAGLGGGTGSGAIPDLAYAIRSELKRCGLPHDRLRGVLMHASPRSHTERDKSRANGYALLRELHHFSVPGGHYPGEVHLNAVPFHGDNSTFGELLSLQLGEGLGQTEWELAVEQAAEFLYATHFTSAEQELHGTTKTGEEHHGLGPLLARPAQVIALGAGGSTTIADAVRIASDDIIQFWREGRRPPPAESPSNNAKTLKLAALTMPGDSDTSANDAAARQQFQQCQFNVEHLIAEANEVVNLESGQARDAFLASLIEQALAVTKDVAMGTEKAAAVTSVLDRCLRSDFNDEMEDPSDDQLFLQIVGRLAVRMSAKIKSIFGWVLKMVDAPDLRLDGARKNALAIQRHLQSIQDSAMKTAASHMEAADKLGESTRTEEFFKNDRRGIVGWICPTTPEQRLRDALKSYTASRFNEFLFRVAAKICRIVDAEVTTLIEQIDRLSRDLIRLSSTPNNPKTYNTGEDSELTHSSTIVLAYRSMLREQLQLRRYDIARNIDDRTIRQFSGQGKELRKFLDPVADLYQALWQPVIQIARRSVADCIQDINRQLLATGKESGVTPTSMNAVLKLLRSKLVPTDNHKDDSTKKCLVIPVGTDASALGRLSPKTSIVEGPLTDITLCIVERGVSLLDLATELTDGVEMYKDLSNRLLTRLDMIWRELDDSAEVNLDPTGAREFATQVVTPTAVLPLR